MPKFKNKTPSYSLHKASGQAAVKLDGRDHHFSKYGAPVSHASYQHRGKVNGNSPISNHSATERNRHILSGGVSCSSASVNSYSSSRWWLFRYSSARRSLNALPTTDTLLSVMAAAANIGDNRMPKNG